MTNILQDPNICIIGAGAIGGLIAAHLASSGRKVHVIDRGRQFNAIRENGLRIVSDNEDINIHVRVPASDAFDAGPQDIIFLAVKTTQIADAVRNIDALMHENTVVITVQNGVPWWYFQRHGGEHEGRHLEILDPDRVISSRIDPTHIIGCVAYPAASVERPGVIRHIEGNRFPVGELDNSTTERLGRISELLTGAGLKSRILTDLRSEIWLKLWGTLAFNPVSMLTRATLEDICRYAPTRMLAADMMREAEAIATCLGISFRVPMEKRIAGAERVGAHKTSTLQDIEAGSETEIDALLGAVIELGRLTKIPTPHLDSVFATCKLLEKTVLQHNRTESGLREAG
jgi:2-dehydropantoate 2-reductase